MTESNRPAVPGMISPSVDEQIGLIGSQVVTFKWSPVSDPSGVTYTLQVARDAQFKDPVVEHKALLKTEYTLTANEALSHQSYFWRVKAVDGASNESDWSQARPFVVSKVDTDWFLVIVIGGLFVIGLVVWRIIYVSTHGGWSAD